MSAELGQGAGRGQGAERGPAVRASALHAGEVRAGALRAADLRAVGPLDFLVALLLAAGLFALYAGTLQARLSGDGSVLGGYLYQRLHGNPLPGADYPHLLYLPAAEAFGRLTAWIESGDPLLAGKLFSAFCAAVGAGAAYFVARGFGAWRIGAALSALLVALSPALWHFATTIEVHAFHFAVTALCACVTLYAPWRWPGPATALVALVFPLLYLSHQAGLLLGLGWVLLVQVGRSRAYRPFRWTTLWLGVAPLLLLVLLATMALVSLHLHGELLPEEGDHREYVEVFFGAAGDLRRVVFGGWLLPLFLLPPLGLVGLLRRPRVPFARAATAAFVLPQMAFFFFWVWWAGPERGGYFLDTAPFLAATAVIAMRLHRLPLVVSFCLGLVLLSMQGAAGRFSVLQWDRGFDPAQRAEALERALGGPGLLVAAQATGPLVSIYVPGAVESRLGPQIVSAMADGLTPEQFVRERALPLLDHALALYPVAFDQSHLAMERPENDRRAPYLDAFQSAVAERYVTRLEPDPSWPMLVIERRKP